MFNENRRIPRKRGRSSLVTSPWTPRGSAGLEWVPRWQPMLCWRERENGRPCWSPGASGTFCTSAHKPDQSCLIWFVMDALSVHYTFYGVTIVLTDSSCRSLKVYRLMVCSSSVDKASVLHKIPAVSGRSVSRLKLKVDSSHFTCYNLDPATLSLQQVRAGLGVCPFSRLKMPLFAYLLHNCGM